MLYSPNTSEPGPALYTGVGGERRVEEKGKKIIKRRRWRRKKNRAERMGEGVRSKEGMERKRVGGG